MFTGRPLPPLPPVVAEADWATGFLHRCRQSVLEFGSDRRIPVASRPVVEIQRDGCFVVVLPNTRQDQSTNPDFFELTPERVHWTEGGERRSFIYYRYETVLTEALLGRKIGAMTHPARIALLNWLKERY